MSRNNLAIALFLIGILIISYPLIAKIYYNYNNEYELSMLNQELQLSAYENYESYNQSLNDTNQEILSPPVEVLNEDDVQQNTSYTEDVIATIRIPTLDIHYPIYDKATQENVDRGVSRVEGTSYPIGGVSSNSVLAAHSYSPYYEWFTNVDKLQNEDIVIINNFKETLYYSVFDMEIINPDQIEKLAIREGQDIITLLTCTIDGNQRILVYAERTDLKNENVLPIEKQETKIIPNIEYENDWLSHLRLLFESKWIVVLILTITVLFIWRIKHHK